MISWLQISCGYHIQMYLCGLFLLIVGQRYLNYEGVEYTYFFLQYKI
jgi:hypothetical protein